MTFSKPGRKGKFSCLLSGKGERKMTLTVTSDRKNNIVRLPDDNHSFKLSIIIPAYNEEKRLPGTLDKIMSWANTVTYPVDIIIVENGSQDRTTEIAETFSRQFDNITVLHSPKGKGSAVREGMLYGKGDFLFICDADLSMPIEEVEKFLFLCKNGYDVVIGSREAPGSVRYYEPRYRHLVGRVFNLIVQVLAVPGLSDTQCGFKLFQRESARHIFLQQTIIGWSFDVEAIYLARRCNYQIAEVPINWYFNPDSRVSVARDLWQMFFDLVRIRLNRRRGMYDLSPKPTEMK
jgi:dolichyl-phosphate beta-glucosyltransferase